MSFLNDFVRHLFDVAKVPSMGSITKYVGQVRTYCAAVCGIKPKRPTVGKQLTARSKQVPKPVTHVDKQPCPKHLVAAVIRDDTVHMAVRLAAVLMWFATLRMGELTNDNVFLFDPDFALLRRDVVIAPNGAMACLHFKKGKPDKTNKGSDRFIYQAPLSAAFCPVAFLRQYFASTPHHSPSQPLLLFPDKSGTLRCVTRDHVDPVIKRHARRLGIDPATLSIHCLRSGSATSLAADGSVTPLDLQIQGGWTSAQGPAPYLRANVGSAVRAADALAIFEDDWAASVHPAHRSAGAPLVGFGHKLPAVPRRRAAPPAQ